MRKMYFKKQMELQINDGQDMFSLGYAKYFGNIF